MSTRHHGVSAIKNLRTTMIALTLLSSGPRAYRSIGLKSTKMLMHVLPVRESTIQGESKRLCSHRA